MAGQPTVGDRPLTRPEYQQRYRARLTLEELQRRLNPTGAPPPPVPEGRLRNLEYDVLLREAFFVPRALLAPMLHRIADALTGALKDFVRAHGRAIARALGQKERQLAPLLHREIAAHLVELGDLHAAAESALDTAAARWKRFPPEAGPDGPALPEWVPPARSEESRKRQAAARARLEEIKAQVRAGILLARWPATLAVGNLLVGWRQQCADWFPSRSCAVVLADFGLDVTAERQWAYLKTVQQAMRHMLESIAAADPSEFARELAPPEELPVSEWADQYRMLTTSSAAEPGHYRTSRTPYLKAIMDDLSPSSPVRSVVFKKASQIGASEAGCNWLGAVIDQAPGPIMVVRPTVETAKRFSQQSIDPLLADSPKLRTRIRPARQRDSHNTMLLKEFIGGLLVITGANSAAGLRSMPVRYLFLDEVDVYAADVGEEGDPVELARVRMRTFGGRSKELLASSPTIRGVSRISHEYQASDQRKYFVPCPLCLYMQVLEFGRLRWEPGKPETVVYQCEKCEATFAEHHKTKMLVAGEWRATASSSNPAVHGYHLSGLYSPLGWLSWAAIVEKREKAFGPEGDAEKRKTWTNTVLGEEHEEEAEAPPDWQRLYERREAWPYPTVPARGLFLTAGADLQVDRIEVDVWAWGRGLESWLIEHIVIEGDPGRTETWEKMTALLSRTWEHETGARLTLQRLAVDTGYATQAVYAWARHQDRATVLPVRGIGAYDRLVPVSGPTKVEVLASGKRAKSGLNLWTVSVSFFKKELYKHLQLPKPTDEQRAAGVPFPAGYVHLPQAASDEWCKQLVAEQQVVVRSRRGLQARTEWQQLRPRNEAIDMRVYSRAAVWKEGCDRWAESRWRTLEEQLGLPPPPPPPDAPPAPSAASAVPTAGRLGSAPASGPAPVRRRRVTYWNG